MHTAGCNLEGDGGRILQEWEAENAGGQVNVCPYIDLPMVYAVALDPCRALIWIKPRRSSASLSQDVRYR
jgi:hypothetical protein